MNFPSKVEVWLVDLRGASGHEQKKERPAAVWKDLDYVKMAVVLPLTETLERETLAYTHRITPTPKNGLAEESIALIFQMRAIDKKRLVKKIGELEEEDIKSIAAILREMLKL